MMSSEFFKVLIIFVDLLNILWYSCDKGDVNMPFDIGKTLKYYRNLAGISVKEISDILTQKGFKASESTIYSWENENSQPTPGALLAMCKEYKIENVLQAFGYDGHTVVETPSYTKRETEHIKKYRNLDEHGRDLVDTIIDKEMDRIKKSDEDYLTPMAAHNDNAMDPEEQELTHKDIEKLNKIK